MKKLLPILLLSILPLKSQALLELRLNYGANLAEVKEFKTQLSAAGIPAVSGSYGIGADVVVSLPMVPFGFGIRYEDLSASVGDAANGLSTKFNRTALLLNYRFWDTGIYIGAIGTYGLSHSIGETLTIGSTVVDASSGITGAQSYSIGIEAGTHLFGMLLGADAGYLSSSYTKGTKRTMDGAYFKVQAGFSF